MATFLENYERLLGTPDILGDEAAFACPFDGCAGYPKRKFFANIDHGGWFCFHCRQAVPGKDYSHCTEDAGGSFAEFAALVGDTRQDLWPRGGEASYAPPQPKDRGPAQTLWKRLFALSPLYPDHADYLRRRGLDPERLGAKSASPGALQELEQKSSREALVRAGLCRAEETGEIQPALCLRVGRILIPYWNREGKRLQYFTGYHPLPPPGAFETEEEYAYVRKRHVKIAGPRGFTPPLYGIEQVPEEAGYVVITEGQFKAAAAIQRGFFCVGLAGMGSGHKEAARALAKRRVRAAVVCFDSQAGHEEEIDREAERLAREIKRQGIPTCRARLPLAGEKTDVDSYLLIHGAEELAQVLIDAARMPYIFDTEYSRRMAGADDKENAP